MANPNRFSSSGSTTFLTVVVLVAVLYFARAVLIPLALALLLAFMLAPLVIRFRHWGFGRVTSASIVVAVSFLALGLLCAVMVIQTSDLAHKLPQYQENIRRKLDSVRDSGGGAMARITRTMHELSERLTPPVEPTTQPQRAEEKPVPVEIRGSRFSPFELVQRVVGSLLEVVITASVVIVFVIFMLIEREDLRDRLIRLAGAGRVNLTTTALDDAARRVSRYLLAQLALNAGFGLFAGIGLYFLDVPNPFLWALLAAILRYVPYLGIWVAAIMPAAVAFAVEPGWVKVPMVFGLFFFIDLFMYNLAEPFLYGSSTGVSPLAIIVAAVFWTWLWGPVGLLLATPLTVCVVVIGHHVPQAGFLRVLLTDEQVLPVETRFYQRMLAMDLEDAIEVAGEYLKKNSLEELYDRVLVPALTLAEQDRHRGHLDPERQRFIYQNTRILLEAVAEREEAMKQSRKPREQSPRQPVLVETSASSPLVFCIPARDEADGIGALMLAQLLNRRGIATKALPAGVLAAELLEEVQRDHPKVGVVIAVPPFGYMHARYLCRRLRAQSAEPKVVAAILTEQEVAHLRQRQPGIDADELACSIQQAVGHVISFALGRVSESAEADTQKPPDPALAQPDPGKPSFRVGAQK